MKSFSGHARYSKIFVSVTIATIVVLFAARAYVSRPACDKNANFMEIQSGHLRRLDRTSSDGRVVFLGSSTFQGLDTSAITPVGLNLSIGGDTLSSLHRRSTGYKSIEAARAVVINIGLNDLMQTCDLPEPTIRPLLALVPKATPVVLIGVQAIETKTKPAICDGKTMSEIISSFNKQLLQACNDRKSCQFIDNPIASNLDEVARKDLMEEDGIHLSPLGYAHLSRKITSALSNLGMPTPLAER